MIKGTVITTSVAVRDAPGGAGRIVRYIEKNDVVKATEHQYQWLHLSDVNGLPVSGWASAGVSQQNIRWSEVVVVVDPPPATESPFVSATLTRADGTKVEFIPKV